MNPKDLRYWSLPVNCKIGDRYCGKCCFNTEMPLTKSDIVRLQKLGYEKSHFIVHRRGIPYLRNINGHCIFLDPKTHKCKIYEYRPLGCRLYPLVYDVERRQVTIDPLCPQSKYINRKTITKYAPLLKLLIKEIYGITLY